MGKNRPYIDLDGRCDLGRVARYAPKSSCSCNDYPRWRRWCGAGHSTPPQTHRAKCPWIRILESTRSVRILEVDVSDESEIALLSTTAEHILGEPLFPNLEALELSTDRWSRGDHYLLPFLERKNLRRCKVDLWTGYDDRLNDRSLIVRLADCASNLQELIIEAHCWYMDESSVLPVPDFTGSWKAPPDAPVWEELGIFRASHVVLPMEMIRSVMMSSKLRELQFLIDDATPYQFPAHTDYHLPSLQKLSIQHMCDDTTGERAAEDLSNVMRALLAPKLEELTLKMTHMTQSAFRRIADVTSGYEHLRVVEISASCSNSKHRKLICDTVNFAQFAPLYRCSGLTSLKVEGPVVVDVHGEHILEIANAWQKLSTLELRPVSFKLLAESWRRCMPVRYFKLFQTHCLALTVLCLPFDGLDCPSKEQKGPFHWGLQLVDASYGLMESRREEELVDVYLHSLFPSAKWWRPIPLYVGEPAVPTPCETTASAPTPSQEPMCMHKRGCIIV